MKIERKIAIKKMFWYVIRSWRLIIMCTLVCSILLAAIQYRNDYVNELASRAPVKQVSLIDIKNSFSANQLREIQYVRKAELMIESADEYFSNSILMQIPYDKVVKLALQYRIVPIGNDLNSAELVIAYNNYVTSGELSEAVVEELGTQLKPQYLTEVLSVPQCDGSYDAIYNNESALEHALVINMMHYDLEEVELISESIKVVLERYSKELSGYMGNHSLIFQSENIGVATDWTILSIQSNYVGAYDTVSGNYLSKLANLSQDQLSVYSNWDNLESRGETQEAEEVESNVLDAEPINVSINKKSVVMGAIIGFFLAILFLMVVFIGTQKVRGTEDYECLSVHVLGEVRTEKGKQKVLSVVDKWLERMFYFNKRNYTDEQLIKILYSNILIKCMQKQIQEVYLVGTVIKKEENSAWIESVIKLLQERDIKVEVGEDITCDADARLRASELKNIIIVERENTSVFAALEEELDICKNNGLTVVGAILVQA